MTITLFDIILALSGLVCSQVLMAIYMVMGLLGGASFGKHLFNRILSRIGAILMIFFLCVELWLFNIVARPSTFCSLTGCVLSALVLWSFLMTAFTDPGTPNSPEWQAWAQKDGDIIAKDANVEVGKDGLKKRKKESTHWAGAAQVTMCDRCNHSRPERAHHCKLCDRCVLRMDHHCPLIGSCVGWRNHKYYLLLQWWQFWGCAMFLFARGGPGELALYGTMPYRGMAMELLLYTGVSWAAVVMIIAGKSFVLSVHMAIRNETHVEKLYIGENPYTLPYITENLVQLLGPMDLKLLMPIGATRKCSGTQFPHEVQCQAKEHSSMMPKKSAADTNVNVVESSANYGSV